MSAEEVFAKPPYISENQFAVLQRVAYYVAMSEDSARYQQKLLERTKHLPAFNFLRDPVSHREVIRANSINGQSSPLTDEQQRDIHRRYYAYYTSYRHNKPYIQQAQAQAKAQSGEGVVVGAKRSRSPAN